MAKYTSPPVTWDDVTTALPTFKSRDLRCAVHVEPYTQGKVSVWVVVQAWCASRGWQDLFRRGNWARAAKEGSDRSVALIYAYEAADWAKGKSEDEMLQWAFWHAGAQKHLP